MALTGFEILVNGTPRSFRDDMETAYDAGMVIKRRWPETVVTLHSTETGGVVLTVREDGRRD